MAACDLVEEFRNCDFGDARLTTRVYQIAEAIGFQPNVSLPSAFTTRAELEACYRFMDNEKVTPERLLESHFQASQARIKESRYVLLVQDTTELDLTRPKSQVVGAGPMDSDSRRGAFVHPLSAFDIDGVPLGHVGLKTWVRESITKASPAVKVKKRKATPIEEKESYRWLETYAKARQTAEACPETTCVCVGDSEADIYELFLTATVSDNPSNLYFLIRSGQDRNTAGDQHLLEMAQAGPVIGERTVRIRSRQAKVGKGKSARSRSRESRTVNLVVRKATVEIARPNNSSTKLARSVKMNVVLCKEVGTPAGEDSICWLLITTLPIETNEDVDRVIKSYCARWQIEVYFRILKSGCRVEERRFETIDRVLNCVALFSVVAWRILYVCHLGRQSPDLDCEMVFEPSEWKSVYAVPRKEIPKQGCPKLNEVIRAIARLGGFIDRPKNQPGPQTLWVGLQRCHDLSNGWDAFGPGAKNFSSG